MTIITVRSPKGGVGRTTVTALMAEAFARAGRDVTVMDLDGQDSLRLYFGEVDPAPPLAAQPPLDVAVTPSGVKRMTASPVDLQIRLGAGPRSSELAPQLLRRWMFGRELLIVDTAAGEDAASRAVTACSAVELCLVAPDPASLTLFSSFDAETAVGDRTLYLLNQIDHRQALSASALAYVRHKAAGHYLGALRRDQAVPEACASLQPLADYAPSSAAWTDVMVVAEALQARIGRMGLAAEVETPTARWSFGA